jgi:hypothetical protein
MRSRIAFALLLAVALHTPALLAQAEDSGHPLLNDTFTASIGAFILDKDVSIRVDGSDPNEGIEFGDVWGLSSDETSFAATFRWRFGEKWSLWGQYFDSSDSATAVLEEDISWGDDTLEAGSNVTAGVDLSVARIFAGRIFSSGPFHEFGLGLGLHWMEAGAFVEGEIRTNNGDTGVDLRSVSADVPLPNIGGWYRYAFNSKWSASARVDWLDASIGDYSGGLVNASADLQYQAFKHVGFSLAYQYFRLNIDVEKDSWRGGAKLEYSGPFLAVTANW